MVDESILYLLLDEMSAASFLEDYLFQPKRNKTGISDDGDIIHYNTLHIGAAKSLLHPMST